MYCTISFVLVCQKTKTVRAIYGEGKGQHENEVFFLSLQREVLNVTFPSFPFLYKDFTVWI